MNQCRSNIREIVVCGQGEAEALSGLSSWIAISIHDPDKPAAVLSSDWKAVLQLAFHDKENEALAAKTGLWKMFSYEQAKNCIEFVLQNSDCTGVLVHCFAGASRSPAVARGLAKLLNISPNVDWPKGNVLVLRLMKEAVSAY